MTIASSLLISDNSFGTLASGLATGDTTLAFTSGHGARFPAVAAGQCLHCCILNSSNVLEEILITLHTAGSDTATITRAQGSTTAKAWSAGDRIEARVSSEALARLQQEALKEISLTTTDTGANYTGVMSPAHLGYVTGLVYALTQTATNQAAPRVNINSLGTVTVKNNDGSAMVAGGMPQHGLFTFNGTDLLLVSSFAPKQFTTSLSGDVTMGSIGSYVSGPAVAQGTVGTWWASGNVVVQDSAGAGVCVAKLWDGTTVIDSCVFSVVATGGGFFGSCSLSGKITSPAGNIRIDVKNTVRDTSVLVFNASGESKDCTVSATKIA